MDIFQGVHFAIVGKNGVFPNNGKIPLLLYRQTEVGGTSVDFFEKLFTANSWPAAWRNGVYGYHHYHSTAHEALGCYEGNATICFGGDGGVQVEFRKGEVVVIPAGVAHKRVASSLDFRIVGAYPLHQTCDLCTGKPEEQPGADQNIKKVDMPIADPVFGRGGQLFTLWK